MEAGIKAICIEIGDPLVFQRDLIMNTYKGIARIIDNLKMIRVPEVHSKSTRPPAIICRKSYWIQTDVGGVLHVSPEVADIVDEGDFIAGIVDIFGFVNREIVAPERGVVVGKSTNPSNRQGDRILHLGVICNDDEFNEDGTIKEINNK